MRSGLLGSALRLRASPPSGPSTAHWAAAKLRLVLKTRTASPIRSLRTELRAHEPINASPSMAKKIALRTFRVTAYHGELQVTEGEQGMSLRDGGDVGRRSGRMCRI